MARGAQAKGGKKPAAASTGRNGNANANGKGKGKGKRNGSGGAGKEKSVHRDVYSDDDDGDEQDAKINAKMDIDGIYEYEQPETFEQDSEIDEDEAFDSDDEEAYGSFFNKKQTHKGKKSGAAASDEEEEEEEEDDDEEEGGDLLSDMLGSAPAKRLSTAPQADGEGELDGLDEEEDDEEDDDATQRTKQQNLLSLVDGLLPQASKNKKKKKLEEITEATTLSASLRRTDTDEDDSGELTLSSLLGGGGGDNEGDASDEDGDATTTKGAAINLAKVKKQIRDLEAFSSETSGPLSARIAPVIEERASRKIAYDHKKEEVDLFQPVVRRNRQKETMDFREQIPKMENLTSASLASKFSAETNLEKDVEALLKAGGLSDHRSIAKDEQDELVQKKVSHEEVLLRQKELAKLRALMFYEEQKQRRVKKIKSKLYHKIRNNQNKKEQEKQHAQLRALDPELAKQLDDELAEKRAEERLTLKHTNTSKWVKHQLKRGINADNGTRGAIAEQLRRGTELRRKMQTVNSDEEDDEEDDGEDGEEDEGADPATRLQKKLHRQATALVTEMDQEEADAHQVKGLAGMKFMQRAVQKQREKARSEAEKLLREINGQDELLSDGDAESEDDKKSKNKRQNKKQKVVHATEEDKHAVASALPRGSLQTGSVSMDKGLSARAAGSIAVDLGAGGAAKAAVDVTKGGDALDGATMELGNKKRPQQQAAAEGAAHTDGEEEDEGAVEAENPWLSSAATKNKKKSKKDKKTNGQKATVAAAAGALDMGMAMEALAKSVAKKGHKTINDDINIAKAAKNAVGSKRKANAAMATAEQQPEEEAPATTTANKKAKKSTENDASVVTQEELVRRAFAFADEGENEIQQEKEDLASRDTQTKKGAEIAKLVGMTGWGSWAGEGIQKSFRQKKREESAVKLAEATKKSVLLSRKDSKMDRVLINEKKDKRASKFAVQDVPYPFTSREEYEMAMRNPLGSDWNTSAATNALTKPKLITRAGQMIDPLKLSKEDKKQAKKELGKKRKAKF